MSAVINNFLTDEIRIRWKEVFLTEALNAALATATPHGVYRGFLVSGDAVAMRLTISPDPVAQDNVAYVHNVVAGYEYSIKIRRVSAGYTVTIPDAYFGMEVVVCLYGKYQTSVDTIANMRVYSIAEYNAAPEKGDLVILATVQVPSSSVVIPSYSITTARRQYAWLNEAPQAVPFKPVFSNPSFEWCAAASAGTPVPHWFCSFSGTFGLSGKIVATDGVSDLNSLEVGIDASGMSGQLFQINMIRVKPGDRLMFRFYVKRLAPITAGNIYALVDWADADGVSLSPSLPSKDFLDVTSKVGTGGWTLVEMGTEAPTGAHFFRSAGIAIATLVQTGTDGNPGLRFDDFQVWVERGAAADLSTPQDRHGNEVWGRAFVLEKNSTISGGSGRFQFLNIGSLGYTVSLTSPANTFAAAPALQVKSLLLTADDSGSGNQMWLHIDPTAYSGRGAVKATVPSGAVTAPTWELPQVKIRNISTNQDTRLILEGNNFQYIPMIDADNDATGTTKARWYTGTASASTWVINADWNGSTTWTRDNSGVAALRMYVTPSRIFYSHMPTGTATWSDGAWTSSADTLLDINRTTGYVAIGVTTAGDPLLRIDQATTVVSIGDDSSDPIFFANNTVPNVILGKLSAGVGLVHVDQSVGLAALGRNIAGTQSLFQAVESAKASTMAFGLETGTALQSTGADAQKARFKATIPSNATAVRTLVQEYGTSDNAYKIRHYVTGFGAYEITVNALWVLGSPDHWVADNAAFDSTQFLMTASNHQMFFHTSGGGTWTSWAIGSGSFFSSLRGGGAGTINALTLSAGLLSRNSNVAFATTPDIDALYSTNIVKAWGVVTNTAGSITLKEGFNFDAAVVGSDVQLTWRTGFADTNYAVVFGSLTNSDATYGTSSKTSGHVTVTTYLSGGSGDESFSFIVMGRQ